MAGEQRSRPEPQTRRPSPGPPRRCGGSSLESRWAAAMPSEGAGKVGGISLTPRPAPAADTRSVPAPAWGAGGVRASSRRCGVPRAQRSHLTPVPPAGVQAATAPASPPVCGQRGAGPGAAGCRPIPGIFWQLGWARRESSGACLHNVNLPQATYRLR